MTNEKIKISSVNLDYTHITKKNKKKNSNQIFFIITDAVYNKLEQLRVLQILQMFSAFHR